MFESEKKRALIGFLGGVLFMAGDLLLYIFPGRDTELDVDPVFIDMPVWRFTGSAFLGLIGMALMLIGFQSFYAMTRKVCGKVMQGMMIVSSAGVAGTALAHFNLGSLMPLMYKAILSSGGSEDMAQKACGQVASWVTPIDLVIIIALYLQLIVLGYMVLSGKSGLKRIFILAGPVGTVTLGVVWKLVFKGTLAEGAWGSCESLGEGLMYLTVYMYWRKQKRQIGCRG